MKGAGSLWEVGGSQPLRGPAYLVASSLDVNPLALRKNKNDRWQKLYPQLRTPQMALEAEAGVRPKWQ